MANEQTILTTLGRNIRARRTALQLSQKDVATRAGLDQGFISKTEAGTVNLPALTLDRIARALKSTPAKLLTPPPSRGEDAP